MSMTSIAETLDRIAADKFRALSDDDKADISDVLDAAQSWSEGAMPIEEFARIGFMDSITTGRVSSGYTRFVALVSTPKSDPRRAALLKAIDAVIVFEGYVFTTSGVWTPEEIGRLGMRVWPARDRAA